MSKAPQTAEAKLEAAPAVAVPQPEKLFPVVLVKNYMPAPGINYEIIGHLQPKVENKDAGGRVTLVSPEKWIDGEPSPAPIPGAGYPNKLWAGTHVRVPVDEAKRLIAAKAAERADDIAA
mgnify:CR=1 FL=1